MRWAFDQGCNYLVLGPHRHRAFVRGLGQIVRGQRDDLVLGWESAAARPWALRLGLELALARLGTDRIDVLVLGPPQVGRAEEFLDQAERLKRTGKVRAIALSYRPDDGASASALLAEPIEIVHATVNAATPALPAWRGVASPAFVGHSATAHGALLRTAGSGLEHFATVADCYRFVLSHPQVSVCLAGAPGTSDLTAALAALARGPMTDEDIARMCWIGQQHLRTQAVRRSREVQHHFERARTGGNAIVGRVR